MRRARFLWALLVVWALVATACGGGAGTATEIPVEETVEVDEGEVAPDESTTTTTTAVEPGDSGVGEAELAEEAPAELAVVALFTADAPGEDSYTDAVAAGLEASAAALGHEQQVIVSADFDAREADLRALADTGPAVVLVSDGLSGPLNDVHEEYPEIGFVYLGNAFRNNAIVNSVGVDSHDSGYVAGVYAASISETGTLGYVGGQFVTSWEVFVAFMLGAQSVNPAVEILANFDSGFSDTLEASARHYAAGADVVLSYSDEDVLGAVDAAVAADGIVIAIQWAPGGDIVAAAPANVAMVVEPAWEELVQPEIELALAGERERNHLIEFAGGDLSYSIDQRFIDAAGAEGVAAAEVAPRLDAVIADLMSGALELEDPGFPDFESFE